MEGEVISNPFEWSVIGNIAPFEYSYPDTVEVFSDEYSNFELGTEELIDNHLLIPLCFEQQWTGGNINAMSNVADAALTRTFSISGSSSGASSVADAALTRAFAGAGTIDGTSSVANAALTVVGYHDNFEDNKTSGRSSPYRDWTQNGGTLAIESSSPITGSYSLKHTGGGSSSHTVANSGVISDSLTTYIAEFDFKLTTQGVGANTPYVFIFLPRYVDSQNALRLETRFESPNQIIRLNNFVSNANNVVQSVTWIASAKLGTSTTYHFKIVDTGSHFKCYIDSVLFIDTDYSSTLATTKKGCGCDYDSVAVWDNLHIG